MSERDSGGAGSSLPHLSFSRMDRYLLCPESYRLYYVENLRPKVPPAALAFGQAIHQALAHLFSAEGGDPVEFFTQAWQGLQGEPLRYPARQSWEGLCQTGVRLLTKFVEDEVQKIRQIEASEKTFELAIPDLDVPFIGVIDLIADWQGLTTVVDFKTSASGFAEHEVVLSDQLTAYHLAVPEAEMAALCVLVKTKEPRIDWHFARRGGRDFTEFLEKAWLVAQGIQTGRFYKRPGRWCAYCDFLPVCLSDQKKTQETLVRIGEER